MADNNKRHLSEEELSTFFDEILDSPIPESTESLKLTPEDQTKLDDAIKELETLFNEQENPNQENRSTVENK